MLCVYQAIIISSPELMVPFGYWKKASESKKCVRMCV